MHVAVLTGGSGRHFSRLSHLSHRGETSCQLLRLAKSKHLVHHTECGMLRGSPRWASLVCQAGLTRGYTFCDLKQFLPRNWYFFFFEAEKGLPWSRYHKWRHSNEPARWPMLFSALTNALTSTEMTKMWQATENAETASSDGSYTCVPVQGAIEDNAEIGTFRNGKKSVIAKLYRDVQCPIAMPHCANFGHFPTASVELSQRWLSIHLLETKCQGRRVHVPFYGWRFWNRLFYR